MLLLMGCGTEQSVDVAPLVELLKTGTGEQQEAASKELVAAGKPSIYPLLELLSDSNLKLAVRAVGPLQQIARKAGTEDRKRIGSDMAKLANASQAGMRLAIVKALPAFPKNSNVPGILILRLMDSEAAVISAARDSLVDLGLVSVRFLSLVNRSPSETLPDRPEITEKELARLIAILTEDDVAAQIDAVKQLMSYRGDEIPSLLVDVLDNAGDKADLRLAVVNAMSSYVSRSTTDALVRMLADNNPGVVVLSALALEKRNNPKAEVFLAELRKTTAASFDGLADELKTVKGQEDRILDFNVLLEALAELEPEKVKNTLTPLLDAETTASVYVRRKAALLLSQAETLDDQTAAALRKAMDDDDVNVRLFAAEAVGRTGDVDAAESLVELLSSADRVVRFSSSQALGRLGPAVVPFLIERAQPKDGSSPGKIVRVGIAQALGEIGDTSAAPVLLALLADAEVDVRIAVALALGKLGVRSTVQPLVALLNSTDDRLRWYVGNALEQFGATAEKPLLAKLDKEGYTKAVLEVLGRAGTTKSLNQVAELFFDSDYGTRVASARSAAAILDRHRMSDADQANFAAKLSDALEEISQERGLTEEQQALSVEGRAVIAMALGRLGGGEACEILLGLIAREWDETVRVSAAVALQRASGKVSSTVAALQEGLQARSSSLRLAAAKALGREAKLSSIPSLVVALEDKDERVRMAAALSLKKITGRDYLKESVSSSAK